MTKFSRIIQGCMTWGAWGKQFNEQEMIATMHHCLEAGITTFDHADIYGDYTTEEDFGNAFAKADIPRDSIQLISKCGIQMKGEARPENTIKHYQYDANYVISSAERSLKMLQTEYLDLFLLHRPSPLLRPDEVSKAVEQLKSQGKIKAFGLSNFTPAQTDLVRTKTEVVANQIEISLTTRESLTDGSLDYMMTHGIAPMSWSPLGSVFREDTPQNQRIKKKLKSLSEKYNAKDDQLLLAWLLKHPSGIHPVIGTTNKERITNAVTASDIELELKDWFELLEASVGEEVA
ncbi:aldo/keto reductase [Dokdonia sinensis]|uniref:Aldo/keto reductase n=2 Tax=Dokdonia sinensis TaxID=2479847 RepID=A0A3M0GFS9_9FLAO|nr:aldo/keto reductase [Dokdonia sinensis]RMB63534.1 aldo/keto reductase [Dokdonia sinensis]